MTSPATDAASNGSPSPSRLRPAGPLAFMQPEDSDPSPSPSPTAETTGEDTLPHQREASDSAGDWPTAEPDDSDSPSTSYPSDSEDDAGTSHRPFKALTRAGMRATGAKAVLMAGGAAHRLAARTEEQRAVGMFLADEEDAENIGHPLADLAHRRGALTGGKALSPDANDAVSALMGLAGYVSKQVARHMAILEHQRAQAQPTQTFPEDVP